MLILVDLVVPDVVVCGEVSQLGGSLVLEVHRLAQVIVNVNAVDVVIAADGRQDRVEGGTISLLVAWTSVSHSSRIELVKDGEAFSLALVAGRFILSLLSVDGFASVRFVTILIVSLVDLWHGA